MKITFSPVTRISGLLSINLFTDPAGRVCEAQVMGEQFRGFESMMRGRKITDAVYFTERICGICSMAHGYTAARMVGQLYGSEAPPEMILLQQAMLGAEFLQNHIRHFYLLALPDYLDAAVMGDATLPVPASSHPEPSRLHPAQQRSYIEHYFASMAAGRKCHEMLAVFGGKVPHQHGLVAAGVTVPPSADRRIQFQSLLEEVSEFIHGVMLPDAQLLAEVYPEYRGIGAGPGHFLSFGLFDPRFGGHFPAGLWRDGALLPVRATEITESILHSWFEKTASEIEPSPAKPGAYTWVKAPRYQGMACEGGPLARKIIAGPAHGFEPPRALGVMERIVARAEEAALISDWIKEWIRSLPLHGKYIVPLEKPVASRAFQANDAPRGPLLHSAAIAGTDIESYTIITPSTWNFSPKDEAGGRGPAETALLGCVAGPENPTEPGRIVRSFDPCLSCATRLLDLDGKHKMTLNTLV
ncbi:hydrogenase large subunit [Hydrogenispora ethanolica]|uniref:Hydrogenase large subunit n=1 Tax=Hydrogenispora ethanolica TaxID=1082276 RepID=A0A4R1R8C3_HYDET|nr:nickel-dependent hydrogenase large subunit [Hydrogenispora ethanolica]TCL61904.1 hydrogenase large subunit [Hydrogenispora ethanolica]